MSVITNDSTVTAIPTNQNKLKREFKVISAATLGFTLVSPIVALYAVFGFALQAGSGASIWGFVVCICFQFLVALVFAELVSKWPLAGGVYQWTRKMMGNQVAWYAGWVYICTLICGLSLIAYSSSTYIGAIFGYESLSSEMAKYIAIAVVIFSTLVNIIGRKTLKFFMFAALFSELIGSIGIATWLLMFHQVNDLSIFTHTADIDLTTYFTGASFATVLAIIGFSFFGFESVGSIAEEIKNPDKEAPKALLISLFAIGAVVTYTATALILAIPNLSAILSGDVADPVVEILMTSLGSEIMVPLMVLFSIAFVAALIAVQTGLSRVIFGLAREKELPLSKVLGKLSTKTTVPTAAIIAIGLIVSVILSFAGENTLIILLSLTTAGFFISFLFPTISAFIYKLKGLWEPSTFNLGSFSIVINIIALIWLIFSTINVAWPRTPEAIWYMNWAVVLAGSSVLVIGFIIHNLCIKNIKK